MRTIPQTLLHYALCIIVSITCSGQEELARESPGSSTFPVQQKGTETRHAEKIAALKDGQYDLLMIGDSITHNFDRPEFKAVWDDFYAPRNAISLGYSGGRTENTLWNLANGELEGQSPKVVTLLIGTNNSDDANYPIVHNAEEIAAGTKSIVEFLRQRLPETKILLLRIFPRTNEYRRPDGTERGSAAKRFATNLRAGELVAALADDKHVFYLDLNHIFLQPDGSIDPQLMPDLLHPSPAGARKWAEAMEPLLSKLLGDEPRCATPSNNALIPVPKIEEDFYDWWKRHEAVLKIKDIIDPEIVLLGDSITHLWGGLPEWEGRAPGGAESFAKTFAGKRVLNLGYGYDRIQNVLWRLDHGEVEGLRPEHVVVNIGTNNLWPSHRARGNTVDEIADGVREIVLRLRAKLPDTQIILMGLFPRGERPDDRSRAKIAEINARLTALANEGGLTYIDLKDKLTEPGGTISKEVMGDFLHPGEKGYAIWGEALAKWIRE
ncbi:MAG: acetylhydrolase [Verrucomicrobiae bacterium]|nr:acetylhydrolase [Verrucomicrobiae bacterium]